MAGGPAVTALPAGNVACSVCTEPTLPNITGMCVACKTSRKRRAGYEEANEPHPLARTTDPATSHVAARVNRRGRYSIRQQCLLQLRSHPGQTAGQVGESTGLGHQKVWRRLSELKNDGLVYAEGTRQWEGNAQDILYPTEAADAIRRGDDG